MNLFRNRNSIEKRLHSKLRDYEAKPTASLWDRIESELPEHGMEFRIRQKANNFEKTPDKQTWINIEQMLEKEERHINWWKYAPLLALIFISAVAYIFINNEMQDENNKIIKGANNKQSITEIQLTKPDFNVFDPPNNTHNRNSSPNNRQSSIKAADNTSGNIAMADSSNNHANKFHNKQANNSPTRTNNLKNGSTVAPSYTAFAEDRSSNSTNSIANSETQPDWTTKPDLDAKQNNETKLIQSQSSMLYADGDSSTYNDKDPVTAKALDKKPEPILIQDIPTISDNETNAKSVSAVDDELSRFSLGVLAGANYCMMQLRSPQSNRYPLVENTALRQSIERPQIDVAIQFALQYHLTDKLSLSSGVGRLLFRQTFFYNVTAPSIGRSGNELPANSLYKNDSIVAGNTFRSEIRYSWTEIPLSFHYQTRLSNRFNLHVQTGISYAILANADVSMVNYDNIGVLIINGKDDFPGFRNNIMLQGGIGILWQLNNTVHLNFQPHFRAALNNMVENSNWVEQRPVLPGLQFGLYKRL